jgi:cystathionine gamma-lyase
MTPINATSLRMTMLEKAVGGIQSLCDRFLALRRLKALRLRGKEHCENMRELAERMKTDPAIEEVIYPELAPHPQHALARQQMRGFGGVISIHVKGGG